MFYSNQRKYFKETVLLAVGYLNKLSTWKESMTTFRITTKNVLSTNKILEALQQYWGHCFKVMFNCKSMFFLVEQFVNRSAWRSTN